MHKLFLKKRFFFFSFHQFVSDHLGQQDNEEEQKKLHHLKSLLLKHKGNKDIPEKTLIRIVDLMDQLNVCWEKQIFD